MTSKFLSLLGGAALGQGSFFALSFALVSMRVDGAGDLTTAIGLVALFSLAIDWGGATLQRQAWEPDSRPPMLVYVFARIPVLLCLCALLIVAPAPLFGSAEAKSFVLFSGIGLITGVLNMSGYLDLQPQVRWHGWASGINVAGVTAHIALSTLSGGEPLNFQVLGAINGALMACVNVGTFISALRSSKSMRVPVRGDVWVAVKQGAVIVAAILPGQLNTRTISVSMLALASSSEAAIFNLIKACFSLVTQCVTLARRAEYRRALETIATSLSAQSLVHQRYSLLVGISAIVFGFAFLLTNSAQLGLPVFALFLALVHALVWLVLSAFFHARVLRGRNAPQSLYAGISSCVVVFAVGLVGVKTSAAGLLVEILASLCAFSIYVVVGKVRLRRLRARK